MAHAYTPGLKVVARAKVSCKRILPIAGEVLVQQGQTVTAQQIVAQTLLPGDVYPVNLANTLGVSAGDLPKFMKVEQGQTIEKEMLLAESPGFFGLFKSAYHSKISGSLETISKITGQVILRGEPIPVEVKAYLPGTVVEVLPEQGVVIEAPCTQIQGIFGIGGEVYGEIQVITNSPDQKVTPDLIDESMAGKILVGGGRMTHEAIEKAIACKVSAVVSGGIDDEDLKLILGYDLGVAITGTEDLGTSLIVTEGFGDISMAEATYQLFCSRDGAEASANGATQIRAGVMRPEIIIPLTDDSQHSESLEDVEAGGVLDVETPVRIIRDPYFGEIGKVSALPHEPMVLESGSRSRVLQVVVEDGREITVPRANVEIITR